ncbi:MFS transporter [Haloarchaeobius salinus]|uniref:MFS transporter n=1 Tax=Haloarchaeobius salinus TaxID=1198298 RepID=UPI00210A95F9|nr:MFS transporter [Haloarchaeobius salinus]
MAVLFGKDYDIIANRDFQLVLLANLAAPLGTALLSPLLDSLTAPFRVSSTEIGLLITVFTAPGIFIIPLTGALSDRYGRKPILVFGLVLFGVTGSSIALTADFHVALALRFFQGAGLACITPVLITSIGDMYEGGQETTGQGLRFGVSGLTATVFPVLAGVLVVIAWQYPFLIYSIAIPIAVVVFLWFEEPLASSDRPIAARTNNSDDQYLWKILKLLTQVKVGAFLLARVIPVCIYIGFLTYNSVLTVQLRSGTPLQAGILVGVTSMTYALVATQAGRIRDALDGMEMSLIAGNACLGFGLIIVTLTQEFRTGVLGATLLGTGFGITLAQYRSTATKMAPEAYRGGLVSIAESIGRIGATLTPVGIGVVVSVFNPILGFQTAVQWTMTSLGLGGAILGITSVLVMSNTVVTEV